MQRCDLSAAALIFGGVLVALTALGGAMDGGTHWAEDIKVATAEHAQGVDDLDVWTACKKNVSKSGTTAEINRRCRETASQASH